MRALRSTSPHQSPDHAPRQEQRDQDEQQPEEVQPVFRKAPVSKLFAPFTKARAEIAPTSLPRPPTATQIAISIEFAGDISLGLMMPTCGTYRAPAMPQITAESVQMNSL